MASTARTATRGLNPKQVITRFFEEIWNQKRLERFEDYVADDFATSGPKGPLSQGIGAFRSFTESFLAAVPDYRIDLLDVLAEGEKVTVRWICRGTHRGTLLGVPATGRRFSLSGISIYRIQDGKLAEVWRERDFPGMWRHLLPELQLDDAGLPASR